MEKSYKPTKIESAKEIGKTAGRFGLSFAKGFLAPYMLPTTARKVCDVIDTGKEVYLSEALGGMAGFCTAFGVSLATFLEVSSNPAVAAAYALTLPTNVIDAVYELGRYALNKHNESYNKPKKQRVIKENLESTVIGEPVFED